MNRWQDISISDASLKAEFITKFFNGDYIDAFTIISNNPQLNTKAFVADTINQIATILLSLENNFQNGVINYLSQQYSNFQNIIDNYNLKGNWNASTTYQIYNFVTYNNIDYLYINLTPSSGNLPTNTEYWVEVNIQGEKGAPGLGVNLQYNWNPTTPYNALDVVYYNNALWVARVANINKIPGSTEEWETLTGSIVSFYNDGDIEISNLSVAVEPVQAGSGDPSPDNVRPISGWDAVGIESAGKNMLSSAASFSRTVNGITFTCDGNGNYTISGTSTAVAVVNIPLVTPFVFPDADVFLHLHNSARSNSVAVVLLAANQSTQLINKSPNADYTVSTAVNKAGQTAVYIQLYVGNGATVDMTLSPMVLPTSSATDFVPYSGNTYTISIGQTVYGCKLTISEDGSVTALVDRAAVDMGTLTWESGTYGRLYNSTLANVIAKPIGVSEIGNYISERYQFCNPSAFATDTTMFGAAVNIAGTVFVRTPDNTPAGIMVYELATPITITLDPVTISTIANQTNNVWADAGDVTVELDKKYWEEFIKFKLASIYTNYIEPSEDNLYNGLIWFEVFNPQNWNYLTNRNYTWNQVNTNNDTWESVDRGDY